MSYAEQKVKIRKLYEKLSSRIFMGGTTLFRLLISFSTFAFLARSLGPSQFGFYASTLAYSAMISMISDFGFTTQILRDIASDPAGSRQIIRESVQGKTAILMIIAVPCLAYILASRFTDAQTISMLLLSAGTFIGAYGDLSLIAFRSLGLYRRETEIVTMTGVFQAIAIASVCTLHAGLVVIAFTFAGSRLFYCLWSLHSIREVVGAIGILKLSISKIIFKLKASYSYAVDAVFLNLSTQIDVMLVTSFLGFHAAGIYQAGGRPLQIALGLSAVPYNIHVPRLSESEANGVINSRYRVKIALEWVALGFVIAITFVVAGPIYEHFILKPSYQLLNQLWPAFGVLIFLRYLAGPPAIFLLVAGEMKTRVVAQVISTIAFVGVFIVYRNRIPLQAVPIISCGSTLIMISIYFARFCQLKGRALWRRFS